MNSLIRLTTLLLLITFSMPAEEECKPPAFSCFGLCVDSKELCPVEISCQDGFYKINHYTCSKKIDFAFPSQCKQNEECWNGSCQADRKNNCPTMMTCPPSIKTRCSDNSCVNAIEDCPFSPDCPTFLPIRCPNGDCRNSLEDCPSSLICPSKFSIQCNDGSCRMLPNDCLTSTLQTQCIDKKMTRCPDGTCKSAKFLCSSSVSCPNGLMKCWNGKCTIGQCEKPTDSQTSLCSRDMVNCPFDYSCKRDISFCPTGIICPIDRPVKCWDMSCKETITKCPKYQECPGGLASCPDGSCAKGKCGTHITCSNDAPFKCFDNTCRINPQDCPKQFDCPSESPILCWDGRCVLERGECLAPEECESDQVKCPDNLCKNSFEECKAIMDCPNNFSKCSNGVCRRRLSDCQEHQCPLNFPQRCGNGMCVSKIEYCDKENGCPFNKPIKCKDGRCDKEQSDCPMDEAIICKNKLCPDGSCLPNERVCPEENGCPIDLPHLCGDGTCISLKGTCPIPMCPIDTPVRCSNGACAVTASNCPKTQRLNASSDSIICADGTEKPFFEECKPLIQCPSYQVRCENGSCQDLIDYCPQARTCPNNQIRCDNGSCALSLNECLNDSGCPKNRNYKCAQSGLCVKKAQDCLNYQNNYSFSNGCSQSSPLKCVSGKCVSNLSDCIENMCKGTSKPVLCLNGDCAVSARQCPRDPTCIEGYDECPDGQCREKGSCLMSNNCPNQEPFRCPNGECKRYPLKHNDTDTEGCSTGIRCPDHKPILCADGSCEEKSIFCLTHLECPDSAPYSCFDRTCVVNSAYCSQNVFQCPARNPILCSNGNCVSELSDCYEMNCPSWKPYLCVTGKCAVKPKDCITTEIVNCKEGEVQCQDGTCRLTSGNCPLYSGCTSFSSPKKCSDGSCIKPNEVCPEITEEKSCKDTVCEDGICRKECPPYNGCPNSKPFMCSTGKCVTDMLECIGESNCPQIDLPFRCTDGSCASQITGCKTNVKGFGSSNLILSIFPGYDLSADIILGEANSIFGSLFLPSDSITKQEVISKGTVKVKSIPQSQVKDTYIKYNSTRKDDVNKVFAYSSLKSNLSLEYEYGVLSSVISIEFTDPNIQIRNYFLLTLAYDFPYLHESHRNVQEGNSTNNTYSMPSFKSLNHLTDVCLGKLKNYTRQWECVNLKQKTESLIKHQLEGAINSEGIFAVILNPEPNTVMLEMVPDFFIDNIIAILVSLFVVLIALGTGLYVFSRIIRFKAKYQESRKKFAESAKELDLMKSISSCQVGQNIGDSKEGVIFTDNPAFKAVKVEEKSKKRALQLQSMIDSYLKRLKILDKNNSKLQTSYDHLNGEYEKLKKYKESLMNPGNK